MSTRKKTTSLLTAEEKAAMKETIKERKRQQLGADGEADVLAKIAEMQKPDRVIAERVHSIIRTNAPDLTPRTWYGMPAYSKDGNVLCFFQAAEKFKSRYSTLGFNQAANLDEGDIWPTSFAVQKLTPAVEEKIRKLVKKAAS